MMMHSRNSAAQLEDLQARIGHRFADIALLQRALTHSSIAADINNERLEFLGDRVVNLIVAEDIYRRYAREKEGDLARRHAALVQAAMLTKAAKTLALNESLYMSEAEGLAGGRENDNILADAMEATLGALYLDAGIETCRGLVLRLWADDLATMVAPPRDAKTTLQEWAQAARTETARLCIDSPRRTRPCPDFQGRGQSGGFSVRAFARARPCVKRKRKRRPCCWPNWRNCHDPLRFRRGAGRAECG